MGDFSGHYESLACFYLMFYAAYGELAGSLENRYHSVALGIMSADLLTLCESEKGNAHGAVLCQSTAYNLSVHILNQST